MLAGRQFFRSILILLFFLGFLPIPGHAQIFPEMKVEATEEPIHIQADHISYDKSLDSYTAEGNVEIRQGGRVLTADRVTFKASTHEAEAIGNVTLVQGEDVMHSEQMMIDLESNLGIIVHGTLFLKQQHFYLRGEEIERVGENTYRIENGSFTTCDGNWPAWRFTGREAWVTLEEYASVKGSTFEVKNVPLLYSPYIFLPVKTKRQTGFLRPQWGFSNTIGAEMNNAFFWAIAKNMDATFYLDLATRKGVGEGLEYRLAPKKDSLGVFYGYHIRESDAYRGEYTDLLDRDPDRWLLDLEHRQPFSSTFIANLHLMAFSDRQYFKDYGRTYEERAAEQAYSFIALTKNWDNFSLYGEARHTVNLTQEDKTTLQYYPLINFSGAQQKISKSPFYYSFTSAYGYFYREEGTMGQKLDLYPRLSLPLKWGTYLEVTPDLGIRETLYNVEEDAGDPNRSRELWDFNLTLASEIFRIFDTGWATVPKLKHFIRPEIVYSYTPDVDQNQVPSYDNQVAKANVVTYAITQRLIGKIVDKSGKSRYHEYAYLRVSEPINLFEFNRPLASSADERRPFGDITVDLKLIMTRYLSLESTALYDPYENHIRSTYNLAALSDSRGDSLSMEYRWDEGTREQINGTLRVKVIPAVDVFFGERYSRFDQKPLETFYGVNYRHQCWGIDVTYSEIPAVSGAPAERKLGFMINLLGLGAVGTQ
jgi:LPS-assembly protein